jgi:hypothetical protein
VNLWTAGSLVTSTATFTLTSTSAVADPTTVEIKVKVGQLAEATYTYPNAYITRVSTGVYSANIDTTGATGVMTIEWIGTGAVQAIGFTQDNVAAAPL